MAGRSQSPRRGPSINELVQAKTESLHKACGWRLLKSDKRRILKHTSWGLSAGLINSISGQSTLMSYQCHNVLWEDSSWWRLITSKRMISRTYESPRYWNTLLTSFQPSGRPADPLRSFASLSFSCSSESCSLIPPIFEMLELSQAILLRRESQNWRN